MAPVTSIEKTDTDSGTVASPESTATEMDSTARSTVLFIDHTAELGGGEIALLDLVANLDKTRYHPIVLLFSDGPLVGRLEKACIETHVMETDRRLVGARKNSLGVAALLRIKDLGGVARYAFRISRFIRSRKVDLVHTNSLKADVIGGFAARLARKPLIWHIRDRIEKDYLPGPAALLMRSLTRVIPHCVLANSEATLGTLRLPARKQSAAVYSGLDLNAFDSSGVVACDESFHAPLIGLIGRISRWKGQHVFLEAASIVRRRYPGARFRIVGAALFEEHDYEQEIRSLCESLGLDDCVEFTGFRSDIPQLIAGLDVLVHASISPEPFGQVVVQGMAGGKPVVATRGGGVTEIVLDGVNGLLVPMGDAPEMARAIGRLLEDPDEARKMGMRGRARVEELFTIAHTARKVEHIYDRMLAVKGVRRSIPVEEATSGTVT